MGWTGFNGGSPLSAGLITSLAVLNTHLCTATSLLVWLSMDMIYYKKSSVIGAVQGMITGLVCITPAAGLFLIINQLLTYFKTFSSCIRLHIMFLSTDSMHADPKIQKHN